MVKHLFEKQKQSKNIYGLCEKKTQNVATCWIVFCITFFLIMFIKQLKYFYSMELKYFCPTNNHHV